MFTIEEILKATGGELICRGNPCGCPGNRAGASPAPAIITGVSTDSRSINNGDLFIALEGNNFNGHNFVGEAIEKGAKGVVVRRGGPLKNGTDTKNGVCPYFCIEVPDTLKALGDIAHYHRMRFNIPVIGVTGSNGKTTTKDMLAHILGLKYRVLKNHGTFNNFIGVPLTILKLTKEHEVCVIEMGANHAGEIARLTDIARPNIGIITNIGPSHIEYFKDLETIAQAKAEIFQKFTKDGIAIWNADDGMLSGLYQTLNCKKKTFGQAAGCYYQAANIEYAEGAWRFILNMDKPINVKLLGRHNVYNALAAIAASDTLGVKYGDIFLSLSNFKGPSMRMEILQAGGITIINDSYNSNPKSMESAINVLANFNAYGRKILVSGDMLELGEVSRYFHNQIGLSVFNSGIDVFIVVGEMSKEAAGAAISSGMSKDSIYYCKDSKSAGELLLKIAHAGDVVLIKGSRAMKMENVCSTIYSTR